MSVELNHTIVWCRDKQRSANFLTDILGLPEAVPFGPMLVVRLSNNASLDFYNERDAICPQHYAFMLTEPEFDKVLSRLNERGVQYWADPIKRRAGEINYHHGGRGLYFEDPDSHLLEIITQPYNLNAYPGADGG